MVGWENYEQIDGCNKLKGKKRQPKMLKKRNQREKET